MTDTIRATPPSAHSSVSSPRWHCSSRWPGTGGSVPSVERREADPDPHPDRRPHADPAADPARPARRAPRVQLRHHALPLPRLVGRLDPVDGGAVPELGAGAARGRRRGRRRQRSQRLLGALPPAGHRDVAERHVRRHRPLRVDVRCLRRRRREGLAPGRARQVRRADADRPHVPAVRPPSERHRLRRGRRVVPQGPRSLRQGRHGRRGAGLGRARSAAITPRTWSS